MHDGKYTLAAQAGNAACYAEVAVVLDTEDGSDGLTISYSGDIENDWRCAVGFGLTYAREHLPRDHTHGKHMKVNVVAVKGHAVDTTTMGVAFAAAKAFWRAAGYEGPAGFALDATARTFHVPR